MKSILLSLIAFVGIAAISMAQAPESIKYQAAVRNTAGEALKNTSVGVRISIIGDSIDGSAVYTETFAASTSATGVLNIEIGNGTTTFGQFSSIDWSAKNYFVQLSLDISGGTNYNAVGTTQLVSVPYALYAKTSGACTAMNKIERNVMQDVEAGAMIFCTDCGASGELQIYNGTSWTNMVGGAIVE